MNNKFLFISLFVLFLSFYSLTAPAQAVVGYHQSSLPFVNLGYEINDRFIPELRIGTNLDLEDVTVFELALLYQFVDKSEVEFYGGIAPGSFNDDTSVAIPLGLNIYPFERRNFGFHLEVAPLLINEATTILRGSWGIRYRFGGE